MGNTKNYSDQGGDKWVINGTLEVSNTGQITIQGQPLTRAKHQPESTATTVSELKSDLNALLTKLKLAGLMEGY